MAAQPVVSPPPAALNETVADPVSPVSRSSTFPHKTSPAVATQTPLIDTNTRAINDAPVELDASTPVSPEEAMKRRDTLGLGEQGSTGIKGSIRSPDDEQDIDAEFLGGGENTTKEAREKRAAILAERLKDPSVIVDVPKGPTAEEVEAVGKVDREVKADAREDAEKA